VFEKAYLTQRGLKERESPEVDTTLQGSTTKSNSNSADSTFTTTANAKETKKQRLLPFFSSTCCTQCSSDPIQYASETSLDDSSIVRQDDSSPDDTIHYDIYEKMDMIREMNSDPLYLYSGPSFESSQSAKAHKAVFEAGEMVKDVPASMSALKNGIKCMGSKLSEIFKEGGPTEDMFEAMRSMSVLGGAEEQEWSRSGHNRTRTRGKKNWAIPLEELGCNVGDGSVVPSCMIFDSDDIAEKKRKSGRGSSRGEATVPVIASLASF